MFKLTWLALRSVALLSVLILSGCATTFLYNHADWLIVRQLDRYFDLSHSQSAFAYRRLDTILSRHRAEALPRYDAVLQQLSARVERGLTPEDVSWAFDQYDRVKADVLGRFVADGADFLRLINDQQVDRFQRTLAARLASEQGLLQKSPEARTTIRAERLIAQAEEWLGRLTPRQEAELRSLTLQSPDTLPGWYAYQQRRQQRLVDIVRARQRSDISDRLANWLLGADRDSEHQDVTGQFRSYLSQVILALDRSATEEQRRHFLGKLQELAKTIHGLHQST